VPDSFSIDTAIACVDRTRKSATGRRWKLAVLNSHPIQYFAPLYRRLAREPEVDLTVLYCDRGGAFDPSFGKKVVWDVPLLEGYRYRFLANFRRGGPGGVLSLINPGIVTTIFRGRYDALWIHSYAHITHAMAIGAAAATGTPLFCRTEASLRYDRHVRRSAFIRVVKPVLLRMLMRRLTAALAIGTDNREFFLHYGVPPSRIFPVPYTVDNEYFLTHTARWRGQRHQVRESLGIPRQDVVFLFAAKMIPLKRPRQLVEAFAKSGPPHAATLLMVGDGPELRGVQQAASALNVESKVRFVGFANQSEMPKYYAISDVMVRPDGIYKGDWGLTVNEAMAAGLAVVASDQIGATTDLVKHGVNGVVVPFGHDDALAGALRDLARDPVTVREMGLASEKIISTWSYEECVAGVLAALRALPAAHGSRSPATAP